MITTVPLMTQCRSCQIGIIIFKNMSLLCQSLPGNAIFFTEIDKSYKNTK